MPGKRFPGLFLGSRRRPVASGRAQEGQCPGRDSWAIFWGLAVGLRPPLEQLWAFPSVSRAGYAAERGRSADLPTHSYMKWWFTRGHLLMEISGNLSVSGLPIGYPPRHPGIAFPEKMSLETASQCPDGKLGVEA